MQATATRLLISSTPPLSRFHLTVSRPAPEPARPHGKFLSQVLPVLAGRRIVIVDVHPSVQFIPTTTRGKQPMKLVRFGAPGREKPGIVDKNGRIRDLSKVVPDIAGDALSPKGL